MTDLATKIRFAQGIASSLVGSARDLADEIRDSAHPELAGDETTLALISERAEQCAGCGLWFDPVAQDEHCNGDDDDD